MKKYNWIIYFFILLPSCIGIKNQNSVEIDLSKTVPSIKYSTFVKNIEYSQTIHKSIIINLDKVREVFPWGSNSFSLRMRGYEDQILPIARDKTRILKQHLMGL